MIYLLCIGLLIIISIILLLLYKHNYKKLVINFEEEYFNKNRERLERECAEVKEKYLRDYRELDIQFQREKDNFARERNYLEQSLIEKKQAIEEIIDQTEARRLELERSYQESLAHGKEKVEIAVRAHEEKLMQQAAVLIKEDEEKRRKESEERIVALVNQYNQTKQTLEEQLNEVTAQLEDYRKKQSVINEEILRRRQVEEQQDFYRVVLDESAISDIQILLTIREKLTSHENLDKLIYDGYVAKPVMEMVKRVLGGRAPSGIYKITRLKTGEIYIGKSTDIKKRWTEHCKTTYGVGTIAHSVLHTTIKKDGIENFTFELLEEVPKDKLTEREKYWITFYDSKNYGLNERNG